VCQLLENNLSGLMMQAPGIALIILHANIKKPLSPSGNSAAQIPHRQEYPEREHQDHDADDDNEDRFDGAGEVF
jgi:hypothetical protein